MNLKILDEFENPLLKRKEVNVKFESESNTINRQDLINKLSAILNVDKNLIVVDSIKQKFGSRDGNALVKIYESLDTLKKVELNKEATESKSESTGNKNLPDESGQIKVDLSDEPKPKEESQSPSDKPAEEKSASQTSEQPKKEEGEQK